MSYKVCLLRSPSSQPLKDCLYWQSVMRLSETFRLAEASSFRMPKHSGRNPASKTRLVLPRVGFASPYSLVSSYHRGARIPLSTSNALDLSNAGLYGDVLIPG